MKAMAVHCQTVSLPLSWSCLLALLALPKAKD